jgi:hypothetical protein
MAYGTAACLDVLIGRGNWSRFSDAEPSQGSVVTLGFALICAAIGVLTWKRRSDVFNMALIAASWITLSTTWLVMNMHFNDVGSFFMIAFWLIGASTAAGMLLMHWVRAWQVSAKPEARA